MIRAKAVKFLFIGFFVANALLGLLIFTPLMGPFYSLLEVKPDISHSDAIIVLSSSSYQTDSGTFLDMAAYQRMHYAFRLYKKGMAKKIFLCGDLSIKPILMEMGVPADQIVAEGKSDNTYENFRFLKPFLERFNVSESLLVTSCTHMFRSLKVSRKLGIHVHPAPVPCYERHVKNPGIRQRLIWDLFREFFALAYFKAAGWI